MDRVDDEKVELLIRKNGKILYAVAYEKHTRAGVRYILAKDARDAHFQVLRSKSDYGRIVGIAPAIGMYGKHEERKRIYMFGN